MRSGGRLTLSGSGTEGQCDLVPGVQEGERGGQMQDEAAHRDHHARPELDEVLAQGGDLGAGTGGAGGAQPQFLHQHVGGRGEQHPELVGPEARAAGAADLQTVVQFLDAVLDLAALAVDPLVHAAGGLPQVGDDEAGVVLGRAVGVADHFGLDDDATLAGPRPGGIPALTVHMFGLTAGAGQAARRAHGGCGEALQDGVAGHGDDVVQAGLVLQEVQDLGSSIAAVEPHPQPGSRKGAAHALQDAPQHAERSKLGRGVAGTEHGREQVLVGLVTAHLVHQFGDMEVSHMVQTI